MFIFYWGVNVSGEEVLAAEMWVYWEGAGLEGSSAEVVSREKIAKLKMV